MRWSKMWILECKEIENHLGQLSSKWVTQTAWGYRFRKASPEVHRHRTCARLALQILSFHVVLCLGQCLGSARITLPSCAFVTHLPRPRR